METRINEYFVQFGADLIKSSRASWPTKKIKDKNGKERVVRVNPNKIKEEGVESARKKLQRAKTTSDEDLISGALAGSEKAKSLLYSKYKADAEKVIVTFVRNKEIAKDLAADTFVKVFNSLDKYSSVANSVSFKHWFVRVASNTARDYLRSSQHAFSKKAASEEEKKVNFNSMYSGSTPDKDAEVKEIAASVKSALTKIPAEYRDTIKDFYFDGLSVAEISKKNNISASGVRARLTRGKEALKGILSPELFKAVLPYFNLLEKTNKI